MPIYYVNDNPQTDGYHEVHEESCSWLKLAISKTRLGYFSNCKDALAAAKKIYYNSDGYYYCSNPCHTR